MKPQISIIIPVYNHTGALTRALASVAAQTYRPIEVIVVDDGSDIPLELSLPSAEPIDFHLIRQENAGAPAARNAGFRASKGEYVIFWDADVEADPTLLAQMAGVLMEQPHISFVYSNHTIVLHNNIKKSMPACTFDLHALQENNYIHSTSLVRRGAVVTWDESLQRFQDWDFWLQIATAGGVGKWIDESLFTIVAKGTMSGWLPRCAYSPPWRWLPGIHARVRAYEQAKAIVQKKYQVI
ncbi:MAG: hypothetical protein COU33_01870 [Candidatus Magasanikbacteria bacterium CG10_big_fil_rev_8_21_14_0_10_43_6]|uniref:Glycosyltransferase 2-like domain-containing protein n=1 Tax=Candidatus Magasanikbacteria bacterium CG10_big_fil_rev_8_21_14_0_10_43_6 TaxID=1974650 RepID=A0A2M6W1L2_9BACT|nr:MAG: hypothetical protein COU33_01870 [Candidatus Magasanikbacteria bacterium CG10_big_fil_rev_8_21_14_0_10_43_6]